MEIKKNHLYFLEIHYNAERSITKNPCIRIRFIYYLQARKVDSFSFPAYLLFVLMKAISQFFVSDYGMTLWYK